MVIGLCGNVKSIAVFARKSVVLDDDVPAASNYEIELVIIVRCLIVGSSRGEEHKSHSISGESLDVPDALLPFLIRLQRKLADKFLDRELHKAISFESHQPAERTHLQAFI